MKLTKMLRTWWISLTLSLVVFAGTGFGQTPVSAAPGAQSAVGDTSAQPASAGQPASSAAATSFDQVIDRAIEREHMFMAQMKHLHPLLETYLQNLKDDKNLGGAVPASDVYFLGRLDLSSGSTDDQRFLDPDSAGLGKRMISKLGSMYSMRFLPLGFAQMVILDEDFQRKSYNFTFVRREFLGEIRCIVVDVAPKKDAGRGKFLGRVWIEDQNYNIVRFNGTYYPHPRGSYYLHFDSWRQNLQPGLWLPSMVYSEESDQKSRLGQSLYYKAQTRLWGYNLRDLRRNSEFTEITVDAPQPVQDQSQRAQDATPIEAQRMWERQAELNVIDRLQQIGLLAPEGEIDKVLQTVVNNVIVTNNLDIQPEVHCRVLMTTPLESFTIGHTIVMSRGMIDVLPDEASLAMVLTHELAHIALGHRLDTKLAFNDRLFFPDDRTFERLDFARDRAEEEAADKKAIELLNNSPYKDKLANAGLFLKAVQARAPELKNLIRPHLGDRLLNGDAIRMSALMTNSPQFDPKKVDQVAALPLGGRVRVDSWNDQLELIKTKPIAITAATDKMPFEVTPFFPFLTRFGTPAATQEKSAPAASATAAPPPGQ
ncbi:MAG TPA: M48 family metalloprotease [Terriglobales bacterium]|nr:M48 family metalloprotease [Terriglobales bacterium]